tara:strand:- start:94 stop:468 length:375 start_codon:yes stop_codon:yes gene_type:complete
VGMEVTEEKNRKAGELLFTSIYPLYLQKIKKKGRTVEELNKIIEWLTGFNENQINKMLNEKTTFKEFFEKSVINPKVNFITGVICGYRIEEINDTFQLYKNCRYLDKLVDELSKGKELSKILRT